MEQKEIKALIERRHPEFADNIDHWNFLEACYEGGRGWFDDNIFQYIKEGDTEYDERIDRAYRFNHTREVVDLVSKYIFKATILRSEEGATQEIRNFWKRSTRRGSPMKKFIRKVEKESSIYGRIWVVIDNNNDGTAKTQKELKDLGVRDYGYTVKPQHALDMGYDEDGELTWILFMETARDDASPLGSGEEVSQYRLWTKTDWTLITKSDGEGDDYEIKTTPHGLGIVPAFPVDHTDGEELYSSPALIADIAYLDRAVANYLSNLDAIIQDQTFSQLVMPAQGLLPGEDSYKKLVEMGTKRIFLYDGEHGGAPSYLSPDPRQATLIITVITKIINEIYHSVGMAGERTKQDNAVGIDNSSGVAKAYDFERVNSLLASKAASLQRAEARMIDLVMRWNGKKMPREEIEQLVIYPTTFDIRGLENEFDIANQLMLISAPVGMKKEQMRVIVGKLFPHIKKDLKKTMIGEIEKMKDEPEIVSNKSLLGDESED